MWIPTSAHNSNLKLCSPPIESENSLIAQKLKLEKQNNLAETGLQNRTTWPSHKVESKTMPLDEDTNMDLL